MMILNEFELITTEDGSPSLKPISSEAMHSSKGAFAETLYIYGHGLNEAYRNGKGLNTISVGLGLGYNEMLWAAFCVSKNLSNDSLYSYESNNKLSNSFLCWLDNKKTPLETTYNKILSLFSKKFGIHEESIKTYLIDRLNKNFFVLSQLTTANPAPDLFQSILYDAYSSSTSPALWTEDFLIEFLAKNAAHQCVFNTYAATSALTKALKQQGFNVIKRKGFGFKRESTLAIKSLNPA